MPTGCCRANPEVRGAFNMSRRLLKTVMVALGLVLTHVVSRAYDSLATEGDRLVEQISSYQTGDSMVAIRRLEALAQQAETNRTVRAELQRKLLKLLAPS